MKLEKITRDFIKSLTEPQKKQTSAYDSKGVVTRIEDGIAWVRLAGSKIETPLLMTISAEPGDEVQARIGGGTGWLTGNGTAPPTDDRVANRSYRIAKSANEKVEELEEFTNMHFQKTDKGLLISAEDNEWKMLVSNNGIYVIDKDGEITTVYSTEVTIGKEDQAHQVLSEDSTEWYANEDTLAGGVYYGMNSFTYWDASDYAEESGDGYGYFFTDFISPKPNAAAVDVSISGELTVNNGGHGATYAVIDGQLVELPEGSGPTGEFSAEATFELNDLTAYSDYFYQKNYIDLEFEGGTQRFFFTFIVKNTKLIKAYYGFRPFTPGTLITADVRFEYSCYFSADTTVKLVGEKVFFGESEEDDNIARATNIHNCLRLGQYGIIDFDEQYAVIVGDGEDDENRHNSFTVSKDGYMERAGRVDVPDLTSVIEDIAGLDSSDTDQSWLYALTCLLAANYPDREKTVFEGILSPNSQGFYRIYIYDCGDVSPSTQPYNRVPKYAHGEFIKWQNNITRIFVNNYNFTARSTTW